MSFGTDSEGSTGRQNRFAKLGTGLKGKRFWTSVIIGSLIIIGISGLIIRFGIPSIRLPERQPSPLSPAVEPKSLTPIDISNVLVIGGLQVALIFLLFAFFFGTYQEAKDREQPEDFRACLWTIGANYLVPLLVSVFVGILQLKVSPGTVNNSHLYPILVGLFLGYTWGVARSGGLDFTPVGATFGSLGLSGAILGKLGMFGVVLGTSSGKLYPLTQVIYLFQTKNWEEIKFSAYIYTLILLAITLIAYESFRRRQALGSVIIAIAAVMGYHLVSLAYQWQICLVAAVALSGLAAMTLRRYGRGVFSIGGNPEQIGIGQQQLGSPMDAFLLAVLSVSVYFILRATV